VPTCCPTHSDVEHAKPNPDLFLAAAGGLGVDIRQSFVGGDSIWDLLPHSVPVRSGIGVLSGGFGRSELERANTYRVFDDASDLLTRLDELGVRGRSADLIESICLSAYPLLGRVSSFAVLVRRSRGQRNVECIRVGRPRQAPIPRTPFAGGEVTIRVTDGDDDTEHPILVRQYRDAIGDVRVTRRSSSKMPRVNELLDTYTYADRPLIESWVEPDGRIVDNAIIEMRVGALSFARMGVAGVRFNPRVPPDPDLFRQCNLCRALDESRNEGR
jgi:hypothetical protein